MQARSLNLVALAALTLAAATAHAAAPTAELKVAGTLKAPTCTVAVADGGVYDFGSISPTRIQPGTTHTKLDSLKKVWTVTCDADTYLAHSATDNRVTSVSTVGVNNFGLGKVNGTGNLGYYQALISNPTVDGVTTTIFYAAAGGPVPATGGSSGLISNAVGYKHGWSVGAAQKAGKAFGLTIEVVPYLGGTTTMNGAITDKVDLDGSLTLTYTFGL
ncbi:DUF1120 domain-containing protein [Ralstonia sp. 25C]|uniref:DUF1120 domain-containing protein n=1 Tax=Ralstonia sp. 25C TaxID=3447363 RepID=UPI003F74E629